MTNEDYSRTAPPSTDDSPAPYAVFDTLDPRVRDSVVAKTWTQARELGSRKLRIRVEHVWAVALWEGETVEDAVKRELKAKKERGGK